MASEELGITDFLTHNASDRRKGAYLKSWKKKGRIDVWLHTQGRLVALYRHGWSRLVELQEGGLAVWGDRINCFEATDVLRKQFQRDRDSGERKVPPQLCPVCLLIEHVRREVRAGRLSWTEPVFRFDSGAEEVVEYTAGGVYNAFAAKDITREEIAELRRAGIRRDEAWMQNMTARCEYVFSVVDHDAVEDGVQIAIETTALGDAVKRVIRDQMDALGDRDGNPLVSPYAIRWEYHPKEEEFSKKYRAIALPRTELTDDIRALIEGAAPDISGLIARPNLATLRAQFEERALIELPWDELFGPAERALDGQEQRPAEQAPRRPQGSPAQAARGRPIAEREPSRAEGARGRPIASREQRAPAGREPWDEQPAAPARRPAAPPTRPAAAPPAPGRGSAPAAAGRGPTRRLEPPAKAAPTRPEFGADVVLIPCERCGEDMPDTAATCWNCGARYALDEAPATAAPEKPAGDDWTDGNEDWGMPPERRA